MITFRNTKRVGVDRPNIHVTIDYIIEYEGKGTQ